MNLDVYLHQHHAGTITRLPGGQILFTFSESYANDPERPTLSQHYLNQSGGLRLEAKPTRVRLPPWFSNLLPEGPLRDYLAKRGNLQPHQELELLALLGEDLPGAVRVVPQGEPLPPEETSTESESTRTEPLRFSLAGVQLKFSALMGRHGGLTIPASGTGGDWIVKLPSPQYAAVPENEAAMLALAQATGINVPEFRLVDLKQINGLPELGAFEGKQALAIKRFDRGPDGQRIHMEDLAQVYGIFPDDKYEKVGLAQIAGMLAKVTTQDTAQEFVARIAFIVLTGNGDMHLKNWSLLYPDQQHPVLSPAYDLVSTIPYLPEDRLALNLAKEKEFAAIDHERFKKFANKAQLSEKQTLETIERISVSVRSAWPDIRNQASLPKEITQRITRHIEQSSL